MTDSAPKRFAWTSLVPTGVSLLVALAAATGAFWALKSDVRAAKQTADGAAEAVKQLAPLATRVAVIESNAADHEADQKKREEATDLALKEIRAMLLDQWRNQIVIGEQMDLGHKMRRPPRPQDMKP